MENKFPEGMVPLGPEKFQFSCYEGIACFTQCCKQVDMFLFPYDILRLKNALRLDSEEFMRNFTRLVKGNNPYFPSVMLKLEESNKNCPFLGEKGCSVYEDRPSSCRTYPLERAIAKNPEPSRYRDFYFLTKHGYCLGHNENASMTVKEWVRHQRIDAFNGMNDLWAEIDALFATNPWDGEGSGGAKQQLAFMVCFNIDGFRRLVDKNSLIQQFALPKAQRRRIEDEETELLKFGFEWLKLILIGKSSLVKK